jgi:hypothetical protein
VATVLCLFYLLYASYLHLLATIFGRSLGHGMAWCIRAVRNRDEKHLYSIAFFCFRRGAVEIALLIEMPSSTLI